MLVGLHLVFLQEEAVEVEGGPSPEVVEEGGGHH